MGTQARSGLLQAAAMDYLAKKPLGKVLFAKAWESSRQGSIGNPPDSQPPKGVDYESRVASTLARMPQAPPASAMSSVRRATRGDRQDGGEAECCVRHSRAW